MIFQTLKRGLLGALFCMCTCSVYAGIENLNGTYSILPKDYRNVSVAYGAILVETSWIMNMYDYYVADTAGKSKLGVLVTMLFYRNPGGGFGLTQNLQKFYNAEKFGSEMAQLIFALANGKKIPRISLPGLDLKAHVVQEALDESAGQAAMDASSSTAGAGASSGASKAPVDCVFGKDVVVRVLLAALWMAGKDDRDLLQAYYNKILELAQSGSTEHPLPAPFVSTHEELERHKNDFIASYSPEKNMADVWNEHPELFEKMLFVVFSPGHYAPDLESTYIKFTVDGHEYGFSDCMDTAFRGFMNALWFDPKSKKFSLDYFSQKYPRAQPIEVLKKFYDTYNDPLRAGSLEQHAAWAQLIGNVPGVSYNKGRYEVQARLKNFIILTNYLLQLNLFEKDLKSIIGNDHFVGTYFPRLCEKLGIGYVWQFNTKEAIVSDAIDAHDYGSRDIITLFTLDSPDGAPTYQMITKYRHGEFKGLRQKNISDEVKTILTDKQWFVHNSVLAGLGLNVVKPEIYEFRQGKEVYLQDERFRYLLQKSPEALFYLPLSDPEYLERLILQRITSFVYRTHETMHECTFSILEKAAQKITNVAQKEDVDIGFKRLEFLSNPLRDPQGAVRVAAAALENPRTIEQGVVFWGDLMEASLSPDVKQTLWRQLLSSLEIALPQNMTHQVLERILLRIKDILARGDISQDIKDSVYSVAFKGAWQGELLSLQGVIEGGVLVYDEKLPRLANEILNLLPFERNQRFAEHAIKLLADKAREDNEDQQKAALKIFTYLVDKGLGLEVALDAADHAMRTGSLSVKWEGESLLDALVAQKSDAKIGRKAEDIKNEIKPLPAGPPPMIDLPGISR